jgi:hypothetical protein
MPISAAAASGRAGHVPRGCNLALRGQRARFGTAATTHTDGTLLRAGDRTRHLVSNLIVTAGDPARVTPSAEYTRWTPDPAPALAGVGAHLSESPIDGGHWKFTAHKVRRDWFLEPQR